MDDAPWTDQGAGTVDVALVDAWVRLSVEELTAVRPRLDALNVFPVADADTGTNMLLTMRAGSDASHGADLSTVLTTLARGALLGARGNSGVILAAYLGGIARHLGSAGGASATDLADALAAGAVAARDAVADPVPGTALTAADAAASAARACAGEVDRAPTVRSVATVAADAADRAVEESSSLLAVLRDADVPDAGAAGIAAVLGALARAAGASRPRAETELPHHEVDRPSGGPEFEVMFVVRAAPEAPPEVDVAAGLRQALTECGDSVAVVAGPGHWQGHVHTDRPLRALAAGQEVADSAGAEMRQMCVHSLDLPGHHAGAPSGPAVPGSLGVVVVTASPGLVTDYARAGAVVLVSPGDLEQSELDRALAEAGGTTTVVLPAVAAGPNLDVRGATVVPAPTDLHAVAALAAVQVADGPVLDAMAHAAASVRATRVEPGGDVTVTVGGVMHPGIGVLTLLHADGCTPADLRAVTDVVEAASPGVEIVVLASGRPGRTIEVGVE
ncbi:DAK2 domain-containing protein [Paraoerskovia marina]|uniref:DAK2 domain-containing protein n=1 Tax=Paraoerskovia marina TaxID=545619 RepID=UPI000AD232EA|nr:DAK2 domain-containing protein [Paraoerskovia marina]